MAGSFDNGLGAIVGQAIADELNGGTLEITTSDGTVLSSHTLSATSGTVSNKVLTFGAIGSATIGATGTAALARLKNSGGTIRYSGMTVGTTGTDVVVNSTAFVTGKNASISSATLTQP